PPEDWESREDCVSESPRVRGSRAHRSPRPGAYSNTRFSIPSWSRILLKDATVFISLPGGLVGSMRRYSCIQRTANSAYCCGCAAEIRDEGSPESAAMLTAQSANNETASNQRPVTSRRLTVPKSSSLVCTCFHLLSKPGAATTGNPTVSTQFLYQVCQNYPAARWPGCSYRPSAAIMTIVSKCLAVQPRGSIWHPTCKRGRWRTLSRAESFKALRSVTEGQLSESAWLSLLFSGRMSQIQHAQACRSGAPTLPQLGGSHYEPPSRYCPASGRSAADPVE